MTYKYAKVADKQHLQCQHSLEFNGVQLLYWWG